MKKTFLLSFILAAMLMAGSYALAETESNSSILFVAPYRVVVEEGKNVGSINVSNRSTETRRYDLMLVDQAMDENGVTRRLESFDYSVKSMVRYVPRRFTLAPGERQIVRLQVTRPEKLEDGDYHSHLLFREVPLSLQDQGGPAPEDQAAADGKKAVSFEIKTLYGVAVPIIVQKGTIVSSLAVESASLARPGTLTVNLKREGNAEAAGRMSVTYKGKDGKTEELLPPQWIRVYREADRIKRNFEVKTLPPAGSTISVKLFAKEEDPAPFNEFSFVF